MKSAWQNFLAIGTDVAYTDTRNQRIQITNFVCLYYAILSIPFSVLTFLLIPSITYIPMSFFVLAVGAIMLTYARWFALSRAVCCFGLTLVYGYYVIMIVPKGEAIFTPFVALFMVFLPLPVLLYDLSEKTWFWGAIMGMAFIYVGVFYMADWASAVVSVEVLEIFRTGWMAILCYFTGFTGLMGSLLFLNVAIAQSAQERGKLLHIAESRAATLEQREQELKDSMAEITQARAIEQERQWLNEGLSQVLMLLRQQQKDLPKLLQEVLSAFMPYLGAEQAMIFVEKKNQAEETILALTAAYAGDRARMLQREIPLHEETGGDSLVAQVYLSRQKIYLTDISQDYFHILSGLGEARPACLLLLPIAYYEQILGVLEIASIRPLNAAKISLAEKVAESIASVILQQSLMRAV